MFPDQQNQNGGPQGQPYQPSPAPTYGVNSVPQMAPNGQYQVVPPPSVTGRPTGHNPYEFIVNPTKPQRNGGLLGGNNFIKQIAVLVGGAILLMIVVAILISILVPQKNSSASLTAIAQQQQEIIRVATTGANQATGQATQNFSTNVELAVSSNQNQVLAYLTSKGTALKPKQLALDHNAQTDKTLSDALAASTFDSALTQNLTTQLTSYASSLRTAYKQASAAQQKQILQNSYKAVVLLLSQAKTTASS